MEPKKTPLESRTLWGGVVMFVMLLLGADMNEAADATWIDQIAALRDQIIGALGFLLVLFGRSHALEGIKWPWRKKQG
jgi:hypothetical protein